MKQPKFWDWKFFPWLFPKQERNTRYRELSPRHQATAVILYLPALVLLVAIVLALIAVLIALLAVESIYSLPIVIFLALVLNRKPPKWIFFLTNKWGPILAKIIPDVEP